MLGLRPGGSEGRRPAPIFSGLLWRDGRLAGPAHLDRRLLLRERVADIGLSTLNARIRFQALDHARQGPTIRYPIAHQPQAEGRHRVAADNLQAVGFRHLLVEALGCRGRKRGKGEFLALGRARHLGLCALRQRPEVLLATGATSAGCRRRGDLAHSGKRLRPHRPGAIGMCRLANQGTERSCGDHADGASGSVHARESWLGPHGAGRGRLEHRKRKTLLHCICSAAVSFDKIAYARMQRRSR